MDELTCTPSSSMPFTYKLLNMIAIESPFVKDFRDFSETLKGYTNPKHFMI